MNRNRTLLPVLLLVVVSMLMSGLTAAFAADVKPSFELTGISAADTCHGGIAHFQYFLNHTGSGSIVGWIGTDGNPQQGSYQWPNFGGDPVGAGFGQFGLPEAYPANTVVTFEVSTYSGDWGTGHRTFLSRISFNCTTGAQVGRIFNQAYPDGFPRPNLNFVDGPAFEHPGDIVSVEPGILIVRPDIVGDPTGLLPNLGRTGHGG